MADIHPLTGALNKAKRAEFHIDQIKREVSVFLDSDPYRIDAKIDAASGKKTYYIANEPPFLHGLSVMIGDVIHNLRSALDHLAWQFFLLSSRGMNAKRVYFPIFDGPDHYTAEFQRKVIGFRQQDIDFLAATKPYKGGNDPIWIIKQINDVDKHRSLIAAGAHLRAYDAGRHIISEALQQFRPTAPAGVIRGLEKQLADPKPKWLLRVAKPIEILAMGTVIFTEKSTRQAPTEAEIDRQLFRFDVALNEPQITEPQPLVPLLADLANVVNRVLNSARPLLE